MPCSADGQPRCIRSGGLFDPGRAGGANQGPGVEHDAITNPWDLILHARGSSCVPVHLSPSGSRLPFVSCSPFTVRATAVGSASTKDDARAEIWTPLWHRAVRYDELSTLCEKGVPVCADVQRRTRLSSPKPRSLGVDRGPTASSVGSLPAAAAIAMLLFLWHVPHRLHGCERPDSRISDIPRSRGPARRSQRRRRSSKERG